MIDREYIFTLPATKKTSPRGKSFFSAYQAFAFFAFTA